jgi:hypothetical protein
LQQGRRQHARACAQGGVLGGGAAAIWGRARGAC